MVKLYLSGEQLAIIRGLVNSSLNSTINNIYAKQLNNILKKIYRYKSYSTIECILDSRNIEYDRLGINENKVYLASTLIEFNGTDYIYIKSIYSKEQIKEIPIDEFIVLTPSMANVAENKYFRCNDIIIDTSNVK